MIRFLIIIGVIFLIILLVMRIIRKKFENFVNQFVPKQQNPSNNSTANQVLYDKDDVVVLKGEADDKKQEENYK